MKAIVNTAPGRLEWRELPTPAPGPGQVRIRTAAVGICATDLKMIAGWERTACPAIPGHEWSGIVDAAGPSVDPSLVGRHCVADNVLVDGGEVGFEHPGAYAQFFVTEACNVRCLPDDFPLTVAALCEPLAVAVRALARLRPWPDDAALVFGDGPIGLLMLMLLRRRGIRDVLLVGGRPGRLTLARELGATATFNYHDAVGNLADALRTACSRPPASLVEASGSAAAVHACIALAAHAGRILVLGDYEHARADFAWQRVLIGELELIGSNASAGAWDEAAMLLTCEPPGPFQRLITHRLPARDFAAGMELVRGRQPDVIKVVLEWTDGVS